MSKIRSTDLWWLSGNWFGVSIAYIQGPAAWRRGMKKYAPKDLRDMPYPTTDGRCTTFEGRKDPNTMYIFITLNHDRSKDFSLPQVVALLAHEAVHAWRRVREKIEETDPSAEFEAYAVQSMVQFLVDTYQRSHETPWRKA